MFFSWKLFFFVLYRNWVVAYLQLTSSSVAKLPDISTGLFFFWQIKSNENMTFTFIQWRDYQAIGYSTKHSSGYNIDTVEALKAPTNAKGTAFSVYFIHVVNLNKGINSKWNCVTHFSHIATLKHTHTMQLMHFRQNPMTNTNEQRLSEKYTHTHTYKKDRGKIDQFYCIFCDLISNIFNFDSALAFISRCRKRGKNEREREWYFYPKKKNKLCFPKNVANETETLVCFSGQFIQTHIQAPKSLRCMQ